jgi:opine dehydrogenase
MRKIGVIGAGNGGHAIAGHLGLSGFKVWIYDIDVKRIGAIQERGNITLKGEETGSTSRIHATIYLEEAVKNSEIIMIVTPANAHERIAREMAPYLEDGQIIVLNPGYFLGALCFSYELKKMGCEKEIVVGDTESLIYACRSEKPGEVYISGTKKNLYVATFPGKKIDILMDKMNSIYPQFRPAKNILETAFGNVNPILHTAIALLNAGSIESQRDFLFYYDGATPSIGKFEEKLDQERLAVANHFGIGARSIKKLLEEFYEVTGDTLYDVIIKNPAYSSIRAPKNLQTRLITEDVPMGLVPMASAAEKFGINAPLHRLLIDLASALVNVDYWNQGRTMDKLGLGHMDAFQIQRYLNEGVFHAGAS